MSGKDERRIIDIPVCPKCGKRPRFWTFYKGSGSRMCLLYSRRYALVEMRALIVPGSTMGFYLGYYSLDEIESLIAYVWCGMCHDNTLDKDFIRNLVNVAKQLEITGYVDDDERTRREKISRYTCMS